MNKINKLFEELWQEGFHMETLFFAVFYIIRPCAKCGKNTAIFLKFLWFFYIGMFAIIIYQRNDFEKISVYGGGL